MILRMMLPDMAWYGMAWYGMVWYGMVWYGMVWYGLVWFGFVWYGMVWYGMERYGTVRCTHTEDHLHTYLHVRMDIVERLCTWCHSVLIHLRLMAVVIYFHTLLCRFQQAWTISRVFRGPAYTLMHSGFQPPPVCGAGLQNGQCFGFRL